MSKVKLSDIESMLDRIKDMQDIIDDQTGETYLIDELMIIEDEMKELAKLVDETREKAYHLCKTKLDQELAVANGVCNFPLSCDERKTCKKKRCNYDMCINGYCYSMP